MAGKMDWSQIGKVVGEATAIKSKEEEVDAEIASIKAQIASNEKEIATRASLEKANKDLEDELEKQEIYKDELKAEFAERAKVLKENNVKLPDTAPRSTGVVNM